MVTQCSHCKAKFKARDEWNGKETKCPKCKQAFTVAPFVAAAGVSEVAPERRETPAAVVKERPKAPEPAPKAGYERPESVELSDTLYVYSAVCALAISVVALFLGQQAMRDVEWQYQLFGKILLATGAALGIYSTVVMVLLYYKMWGAIQDGEARTSAGKAVGLLFVPVFNIFWAVYMLVGFAEDYNSFAQRHSVGGERLSKGIFLQCAILWIFLGMSFVALFVLPYYFGIGKALFGRLYSSFGSAGSFRYVVMVWKASNVLITAWLLAAYAILSTRICRAINAI